MFLKLLLSADKVGRSAITFDWKLEQGVFTCTATRRVLNADNILEDLPVATFRIFLSTLAK